jgi:hypothetical protein
MGKFARLLITAALLVAFSPTTYMFADGMPVPTCPPGGKTCKP